MTRSERRLTSLLRGGGTMNVLAIVAVFMPRAWILACHEMLGMGAFPEAPVAEYLARSTSLFYALLGGVLWWLSFDVRRYGRVITVLGVVSIACGVILLAGDVRAVMPWWWIVGEGPFVVALGVAFLLLQARARGEVCAAEEAGSPEGRDDAGPGRNESAVEGTADT